MQLFAPNQCWSIRLSKYQSNDWFTTPKSFSIIWSEVQGKRKSFSFSLFRKSKKLFFSIRWSSRMYDYERCDHQTVKVRPCQRRFNDDMYLWSISWRGFGFITFKETNAVEKVLAKDVHMLDEKQVGERVFTGFCFLSFRYTSVCQCFDDGVLRMKSVRGFVLA